MDTVPFLIPGASAAQPDPVTERFAAAVRGLQLEAHANGRPFSIEGAAGDVVWVHPDGSRRSGYQPDAPLAD